MAEPEFPAPDFLHPGKLRRGDVARPRQQPTTSAGGAMATGGTTGSLEIWCFLRAESRSSSPSLRRQPPLPVPMALSIVHWQEVLSVDVLGLLHLRAHRRVSQQRADVQQ